MAIKDILNNIDFNLPSNIKAVVLTEENKQTNEMPRNKMTFSIRDDLGVSRIPDLILDINVSSLNFSLNQNNNYHYTRSGIISETWGEKLDSLEASGSIGAYYPLTDGYKRGFTFQNLYNLILFYRNNGTIYSPLEKSKKISDIKPESFSTRVNSLQTQIVKNRIDKVGSVTLLYDRCIYVGCFNSFNLTQDSNNPFNLSYSFSFQVRNTLRLK